MADVTITLSAEEAHQTLRALAGRKRTFRQTIDEPTLAAIQTAQNKVIKAINASFPVPLDTKEEKPVVSTRKRRGPNKPKED